MKNKHLILTGATGGLGTAVTQLALKRGALITIPYHSPDQAERLRRSLEKKDIDQINFVLADLRDEQNVSKIFEPLERIDILIHLVGGFSMGPTVTYTLDDWHNQINLNLTSAFLVIKYALKKMQANGYGRIVTIASRAALEPGGQMAAYSAAKAGVLALTRAIAEEMKGSNITANTVLPGIIDTAANRKTMGEKDAFKWVKPASLAEVICFLASEAAGDIRAAALPVYGNL
jgi:NAD(P)-dependent dehydrogenase (short-subunit alcohol dehydrogenase family)